MKCCLPSLLLLTAFGLSPASAQNPITSTFYPLEVGYRWDFRSTDLTEKNRRPSKMRIEVDRIAMFQRTETDERGKQVLAKYAGFMLKSTSDAKITYDHVVLTLDGVCRVAVAGTPSGNPTEIKPALLFFKMPRKKKPNSDEYEPIKDWEVDCICGTNTIKGTFTVASEFVRVPAAPEVKPGVPGGFDTVLISFRDGPANSPRLEIDTWYAKDIGMVKQRIKGRGINMVHELESYNFKK